MALQKSSHMHSYNIGLVPLKSFFSLSLLLRFLVLLECSLYVLVAFRQYRKFDFLCTRQAIISLLLMYKCHSSMIFWKIATNCYRCATKRYGLVKYPVKDVLIMLWYCWFNMSQVCPPETVTFSRRFAALWYKPLCHTCVVLVVTMSDIIYCQYRSVWRDMLSFAKLWCFSMLVINWKQWLVLLLPFFIAVVPWCVCVCV